MNEKEHNSLSNLEQMQGPIWVERKMYKVWILPGPYTNPAEQCNMMMLKDGSTRHSQLMPPWVLIHNVPSGSIFLWQIQREIGAFRYCGKLMTSPCLMKFGTIPENPYNPLGPNLALLNRVTVCSRCTLTQLQKISVCEKKIHQYYITKVVRQVKIISVFPL